MECGRFRDGPIGGKLVETHISWVILTRKHVFKIKKPIHYSFLDFSTASKRKQYCRREVELNNRLTSGLYRDVLPVRRQGDQMTIGGKDGGIIDHVVWMRRLQTAKEMDRVMRRGLLNKGHMDALAEKIGRFHHSAVIINKAFNLQAAMQEFNDIGNVTAWMEKEIGGGLAGRVERAIGWSNRFLAANDKLLSRRIREGMQRDVHGDLHARNIFLYKDPVIFDCIEFNDSFRQIDVLKEIAYFCMDLDAFGCAEFGEYFIDRYNKFFPAINTRADRQLFHYYKSYRANVRAKVNTLRAMQAGAGKELEAYKLEVAKYVDLMMSYW
jgi:aminoglycoside phosphotransferase family enzyme